MTKVDTAHLQAFHMQCQKRIHGVRWFDKVKNTEITIGDIIQRLGHTLFDHIARIETLVLPLASLPLARVKGYVVCMALIQHYLQDDSWRFCSETLKLVSVS